jgi:hypothetical protein
MAKITIDGKEYDTDSLSNEAKAQLISLQFCDGQLQKLQAEAAALQTARVAYARALQEELNKPALAAVDAVRPSMEPAKAEVKEPEKKKGLKGLFGKK